MIKRTATIALGVGWLVWGAPLASGEVVRSPFNGRSLDLQEQVETYSFLLVGHAYGAQNQSVYPAASLLANIERLNHTGPKFLVLLGDVLQRVNEREISAFREGFASKVSCPIFNAVGNHDIADSRLYRKAFGDTFFSFQYGSGLFLFLDGETDGGKLLGRQHAFVLDTLERARASANITYLFLFSHRLLWAINNPAVSDILSFVNGEHPPTATMFTEQILPKLKSFTGKPMFLVSGDVGLPWSLPLFYQEEPLRNLTYVATGLGDTERDAVIQVTIREGPNTTVQMTPLSLTGETLEPIAHYGVAYWLEHFNARKDVVGKAQDAVWRVSHRLTTLLSQRSFWAGVAVSGFAIGGLLLMGRRRRVW